MTEPTQATDVARTIVPDLTIEHFAYPHIGATCEEIFNAFWRVATYMNDSNASCDATTSAKYVMRAALRNMVTRDAEARFGTPGRVLCETFFRELDARLANAPRDTFPLPNTVHAASAE